VFIPSRSFRVLLRRFTPRCRDEIRQAALRGRPQGCA
jgi:hypothetical protein